MRRVCDGRRYLGRFYLGLRRRPWVWDAASNQRTYQLVRRYTRRPGEELYHTADDPFEMHNLSDDDQYTSVLMELSDKLNKWIIDTNDQGEVQYTSFTLKQMGQNIPFERE